MDREIIVEAPAKINLTLDILGKRADGYHELETVMHQISLADRVHLFPHRQGIILDTNSSEIPHDQNNLAYRAAELALGKYGDREGIGIFIEKNIPVGAGLAGGSTDAAAVLLGLDHLMGWHLSEGSLLDMAAALGSDVPFCMLGMPLLKRSDNRYAVTGATALARGRGEIMSPLPAKVIHNIVLVKPAFQMSTAEVYRDFRMERVGEHPDTGIFIETWAGGDNKDIARYMVNVLETVSVAKKPEIGQLKQRLVQMGAACALMSGSGPSVFGIFEARAQAETAVLELKKDYQEAFLVSSY
ncbi:MAG: 4-(cytidine 5'-diphospho)-2-C-methyl-D-erythritol kinase [Deltaproteobacteria bacterium]